MSPAVAEAPALDTGYHLLPIEWVVESRTNPRKRFGDLGDLTASILQLGIIEPLIVRELPGDTRLFEVVAGARRLRAANLASLTEVPCLVRQLSDREALELAITENLQRQDVHPLEEADGYAALMKADRAYTVEAVAHRVGRSETYVYQRLKLRELTDDAREAFEHDEITAAHAVRLARLPAARQKDALRECFHDLFDDKKGERQPAPVKLLDDWLASHVQVDPTQTDVVEHYFPELQQQLEDEAEPATLLQLSASQMPGFYLGRKDHGLLGTGRWKELKGATCKHAARGVIVHGGPLRVLWVCAKKGCPKHWPIEKKAASAKSASAKSKPADTWKAQQEKDRANRALWEKVEPLAYVAIAKAVAGTKLTPALWDQALAQLLGYDLARKDGQQAFRAAGIDLTVEHLAAIVAFVDIADDCYDLDALRRTVKAKKLAIDVDDIVAQVQPPAEATPPKAKPAKKGGRK